MIQQLYSLVFTQMSWSFGLNKNLHMKIYSSFIHNCQNLEAARISFVGKWINKLWYIQMMEYYSALKEK